MDDDAQEKPPVQLTGLSPNAILFISRCKIAAREAGWPDDRWDRVHDELRRGDYDALMECARNYFDVR